MNQCCGRGTVSVSEILPLLERDSYMPLADAALSKRTLRGRLKEIPHYRPGGKILLWKLAKTFNCVKPLTHLI